MYLGGAPAGPAGTGPLNAARLTDSEHAANALSTRARKAISHIAKVHEQGTEACERPREGRGED